MGWICGFPHRLWLQPIWKGKSQSMYSNRLQYTIQCIYIYIQCTYMYSIYIYINSTYILLSVFFGVCFFCLTAWCCWLHLHHKGGRNRWWHQWRCEAPKRLAWKIPPAWKVRRLRRSMDVPGWTVRSDRINGWCLGSVGYYDPDLYPIWVK